jgi:chitinase
MFSAPYNYSQQNYKTEPAAPYPTNIDIVPFEKRDLLEAVLMGNVSEVDDEEIAEITSENPYDIDCNACDVVFNAEEAATYIDPEYAHTLSAGVQHGTPTTVTSTAVALEKTGTSVPPSRVRLMMKDRNPVEDAAP